MENRLQTKPRMAGLSDPIVNDVPHRDDDRNLALVLPSCLRSFMLVEMSGYASNRLQTNSGLCTQFEHQWWTSGRPGLSSLSHCSLTNKPNLNLPSTDSPRIHSFSNHFIPSSASLCRSGYPECRFKLRFRIWTAFSMSEFNKYCFELFIRLHLLVTEWFRHSRRRSYGLFLAIGFSTGFDRDLCPLQDQCLLQEEWILASADMRQSTI